MLFSVLKIAYLIIWFLLLLHCIFKKRFFQIIDTGIATKGFWLFTFAFMNPVLTVLYFIFGFFLKQPDREVRSTVAKFGSAFAIISVILSVVFLELPGARPLNGPVTIRNGEGKNQGTTAHAGVLVSSNSMSSSSSSTSSNNSHFSAARIAIYVNENHLLLNKTAQAMQLALSAQPYINEVTFYPYNQLEPTGGRRSDLYIMLGIKNIKEPLAALGNKLETEITCNTGTVLYDGNAHTTRSYSPPLINFHNKATLKHTSTFTGFRTGSAKYNQQANDIAKQFSEALIKTFDDYIAKHNLLPPLPDYLFGQAETDPALTFTKQPNFITLTSGGSLLANNKTTWLFTDERPTLEVLKDYREKLNALGYRGGSQLEDEKASYRSNIEFSSGQTHIRLYRYRANYSGDDDPLSPMVIQYQALFTSKQHKEVMGKLLADKVDTDTLFIFERHIHGAGLNKQFYDIIEALPTQSMNGYLVMARHYAQNEMPEKAIESLMLGRALARAHPDHNPKKSEIESIAKTLKDEKLATQPIPYDTFIKAGFIDLEKLSSPLEIELAVNVPLLLCIKDPDDKVTTATRRITRAPNTNSDEKAYQMESITKEDRMSSTGHGSFYLGMQTIRFHNNIRVKINIQSISDDQFLFTVYPSEVEEPATAPGT